MRSLAPRARGGAIAAFARSKPPRRRTRWREASWCAIDLELTGLDPRHDEIISFGAIPIEDGRLQLSGAVYQLIRPSGASSDAAIRVHGIRAADLESAPTLSEALETLLAVLAGRALVAHSAPVERAFLGRALRRQGLRLRAPIADTEVLGRLWLLEHERRVPRRIALPELASQLGVPADRQHDALGDALTTAQAFIALATHLDAERRETVGTLSRAGARLESLRLLNPG